MSNTPEVASAEQIYKREGYQSMQPVTRPSYWGVDADPSRRPGAPREKSPPTPFPNARFPIQPQQGEPAVPMHGRPNKRMVPVFGTSCPLQGVSGAVKRMAYRLPDHSPNHWMLKLLGDRVESWTYHAKKYSTFLLPFTAAALVVRALRAKPREREGMLRGFQPAH